MPFSKPIYHLMLAALLLAGLFVSGPASSASHYALQVSGSMERPGPQDEQVVADSQAPEQAFLHVGRHVPGGAAGTGGLFTAGKTACVFPARMPALSGCSKSLLRRRLNRLQEHFDFPQRLSLFPKHGFW
jgi:hypothetical protein